MNGNREYTYRGVKFSRANATTERAGKIRPLYDCGLKPYSVRPFLTSIKETKAFIDECFDRD